MKKSILLVVLFFFVLSDRCAAGGIWQDVTGGLTDREFCSIAESRRGDEIIYIGTSEGLYKKGRNDAAWKRTFVCRGQYKGITHISVDADNAVYIATKDGLYKSRNSGNSWKRLFRGIAAENYINYVICDKENKGRVYLGSIKGLFWTENGGRTWKKARGTLGNSRIDSIVIMKTPDAENFFIICDNEVYRAASGFKKYKKVFGSDSLKSFEENDLDAENNSDTENNSENPFFLLNDIAAKGHVLYLSTNKGLFTSADCGASWLRFNDTGLLDRRINYTLATDSDSGIFAATKKGVFEYSEKDHGWNKVYRGMSSTDARKLMLTRKGNLWALCKRRVYRRGAGFEYPHAPREEQTKVNEILSKFKNEPSINKTMNMAIAYAEVYPEKIEKWRRGARFKALLPRVTFGIDRTRSDTYEIYTSSSKQYWLYGPSDTTDGWDLTFTWDLADLIYNEHQTSIDVRSKLMVQLRDDIVDEVTRAYFARRKLQIELFMNPPADLPTLLKKRLRVQELTATIDGLTGGCFSKAIE